MALLAAQIVGFSAVVAAAALLAGPGPGTDALAWAALAGVGGTLGLGAFFVALRRAPMSLVAPVAGVLAAGIPAAVGIALGDAVAVHRGIGLGLAIAAVVLVSLSASDSAGERARLDLAGVALSVGAGVGFAAFYLLIARADELAAGAGPLWLLVPVRATGLAMLAAVVLVVRPARPRLAPASLPLLLLAGLGDVGGNLFFVLAQAAVAFSVAAVLSSMYPVVTVVLAAGLLRERLGRLQVAGVALAVLAIVLIAA